MGQGNWSIPMLCSFTCMLLPLDHHAPVIAPPFHTQNTLETRHLLRMTFFTLIFLIFQFIFFIFLGKMHSRSSSYCSTMSWSLILKKKKKKKINHQPFIITVKSIIKFKSRHVIFMKINAIHKHHRANFKAKQFQQTSKIMFV